MQSPCHVFKVRTRRVANSTVLPHVKDHLPTYTLDTTSESRGLVNRSARQISWSCVAASQPALLRPSPRPQPCEYLLAPWSSPPSSPALHNTPFNLRFTLKPAAITFPESPQEVAEIVKIGATQGFNVAARSGGHSYIANSVGGKDGALVVDLRSLDKVTLDPSRGTAVIESGNRLGDIALALGKASRALPHGVCPDVGMGDHAAHGGFGPTSRMWGLTLDTITAITTVLANGTMAHVTAQSNPERFWALRGAASSLGIATSLEVTTFPAPPSATIFQYTWDLNIASASQAIASFQSFVQIDIPSISAPSSTSSAAHPAGPSRSPFLAPRTVLETGSYLDGIARLGVDYDPGHAAMSEDAVRAFVGYLAEEGYASELVRNWFVATCRPARRHRLRTPLLDVHDPILRLRAGEAAAVSSRRFCVHGCSKSAPRREPKPSLTETDSGRRQIRLESASKVEVDESAAKNKEAALSRPRLLQQTG
ncbi:putative oxygen-dependent FAD-linked oxidoreductase family protein [Lyophyllum shimeji]|uniref:Oxygen-dependent FAD-linked oxidoreductase family protein n=1 Tax=Lyophyllum shimeji TaxID=47721 RepID=A0A9P3PV07_LYOSH|nr:putative oxygen-dependent FAD-linked oxidoreductase family protein [Lyophyllum shimeji]